MYLYNILQPPPPNNLLGGDCNHYSILVFLLMSYLVLYMYILHCTYVLQILGIHMYYVCVFISYINRAGLVLIKHKPICQS